MGQLKFSFQFTLWKRFPENDSTSFLEACTLPQQTSNDHQQSGLYPFPVLYSPSKPPAWNAPCYPGSLVYQICNLLLRHTTCLLPHRPLIQTSQRTWQCFHQSLYALTEKHAEGYGHVLTSLPRPARPLQSHRTISVVVHDAWPDICCEHRGLALRSQLLSSSLACVILLTKNNNKFSALLWNALFNFIHYLSEIRQSCSKLRRTETGFKYRKRWKKLLGKATSARIPLLLCSLEFRYFSV